MFGCQSTGSEEPLSYISEQNYAAADDEYASASKAANWLSKVKADLLTEYKEAVTYQQKNRILEKYERLMQKRIQTSFHGVLNNLDVRVDDIDASIKSLVYTRFTDSLCDYSSSIPLSYLKANPKTYRFIQKLQEGATTRTNFKVKSIKVNDPTGPLASFELEAIPMPPGKR